MQLTFGEVLGLMGTMISIITGIAIMIYRFTKLEGRVGILEDKFVGLEQRFVGLEQRFVALEQKVIRVEEKVDQILAYLAPKVKRKKIKQLSNKHSL